MITKIEKQTNQKQGVYPLVIGFIRFRGETLEGAIISCVSDY